MSQFTFKMPDLGEGTVDAEIVAWHTKPGDLVSEDQLIVEVMTDKAAVEVPAPVSGRVVSVSGSPGDKVAVGSPLIVFELSETGNAPAPTAAPAPASPEKAPASAAPTLAAKPAAPAVSPPAESPAAAQASAARLGRVMTSPANRRRASEAGIDLSTVAGSGPGGRILTADLQTAAPRAGGPRSAMRDAAETTEIKVIGVRRLIAERMSEAKRNIPHFAYVEEVDVTELESLRVHLNHSRPQDAGSLSYLPLVVMALTRVLESFPQCNVLYDAARGVLVRHRAMHVGIATQTPDGLKVPVVRNAQSLGLWEVAAEIRRLAERARANKATREELVGSTITVTSLGKLGGIASTPIINAPEVAIIGLNKAVERPVVHQGAVAVRRIMNLSSSFDHRFVDGYDAAAMIQALKERLEHPATIFIPTVKTP
ncbi:MAG TPA: dihydrolipoamide acetyltransferase family protein [Steroidobacteraceae bacterium]|nr:dihydrolipoamide acetyltransferase family protein [Steroidobacteraceae bacterium]